MYPYQPVRTLKVKSTTRQDNLITQRLTVVADSYTKGKSVKRFVDDLPCPPHCTPWRMTSKALLRRTRTGNLVYELTLTAQVMELLEQVQ